MKKMGWGASTVLGKENEKPRGEGEQVERDLRVRCLVSTAQRRLEREGLLVVYEND